MKEIALRATSAPAMFIACWLL